MYLKNGVFISPQQIALRVTKRTEESTKREGHVRARSKHHGGGLVNEMQGAHIRQSDHARGKRDRGPCILLPKLLVLPLTNTNTTVVL